MTINMLPRILTEAKIMRAQPIDILCESFKWAIRNECNKQITPKIVNSLNSSMALSLFYLRGLYRIMYAILNIYIKIKTLIWNRGLSFRIIRTMAVMNLCITK